jgi:L-histidine N-alpha-methyltransferase
MTPRIDVLLTGGQVREMLARDVAAGLTRSPRRVRTRWVWDARASEIFDRILELPDYELPRRERGILEGRADEVAALVRPETAIELGSGSSPRTGVVLAALVPVGLRRLVAVDVSEAALRASLPGLAARYPAVEVVGAVADFELQLGQVDRLGRTLVLCLGSTLGGLDPCERSAVLAGVAEVVPPDGALLLGLDLVKPVEQIMASYAHPDELARGLISNLLPIVNRELGADFDTGRFDVEHVWNADEERLEMNVRSREHQVVTIPALGLAVEFREGETLGTEISTKFRREHVEAELSAAGLGLSRWWADADDAYAVCLARPAAALA